MDTVKTFSGGEAAWTWFSPVSLWICRPAPSLLTCPYTVLLVKNGVLGKNSDRKKNTKAYKIRFVKKIIQGGAEPTDTFQIWILRRRDSLSWLAGRGTVEERTPFHVVSRNGALERATTCYLFSLFRRHRLACSVARPYCTRFFPVGVPEIPCVPEAYHDYSRTQTSHGWRN